MQNKTVLITRTRHDVVTNYLFYWAGEVLKAIDPKSHGVIDLKEKRVTIKVFEGVIKKVNPDLIFLNGHGSPDTVTGHKNEPILVSGGIVLSLKIPLLTLCLVALAVFWVKML